MATPSKERVVIHEYEPIDLKSAMLLECFPTVGLVSTIAATYIIDQLELKLKASVNAPWFPPVGIVSRGRVLPPVRLYGGDKVCGMDGNCDQVFILMSEFRVPDEATYATAEALLSWAQARGCREIVSLEGLAKLAPPPESAPESSVPGGVPNLFGVGTTERARAMLRREKVPEMDAGIIVGLSGVLMYLAEERSVDAICLLGEAYKDFPDARAAARLVEIVDRFLKLITMDTAPLLKQAEEIETSVKRSVGEAMEAAQSRTARPTAPATGMYY